MIKKGRTQYGCDISDVSDGITHAYIQIEHMMKEDGLPIPARDSEYYRTSQAINTFGRLVRRLDILYQDGAFRKLPRI